MGANMSNLTKSQQEFVNSSSKFIRLLAPAGCGKTFSIIEKIKNICAHNPKDKISVFTFTRGAADEIRERCDNDTCVTVNTLNSWGNNYIKSNVLKNAQIISTPKDRKFCLLNHLQPIWDKPEYRQTFGKLFTSRSKTRHSETFLEIMDEFKNIGFVHTKFTKDAKANTATYEKHIEFIKEVGLQRYYEALTEILKHALGVVCTDEKQTTDFMVNTWIPFWKDCCDQMQAAGLYTLDDQKYLANIALLKKVEKGEKWNGTAKIDYIFVDEFQDTSPLDLMLISNLQQLNEAGLVIVGDDDQAIYEFRGATPYFILHPDKIFSQSFTTYILDENFRSPANIVEKSMYLISNNKNRVTKNVSAHNTTDSAEIQLLTYSTQEEMIDNVIQDIKNTVDTKGETVAVLSRLKASLLPYQVLLTKESVPYYVSDDLAFFLTGAAESLNRVMEIKKKKTEPTRADLIELVCLDSKNEIYKTQKDTLTRLFLANNVKKANIEEALRAIAEKYPKQFQNLFTDAFITHFMNAMDKFLKADNVYNTLECMLRDFQGLKQNYSRSLEDLYYRDPPLASLLDFASKYGDDYEGFLEDFNAAIATASMAKDSNDRLFDTEPARVFLSTALRVKGQQFDKVIILNVDDGTWPKSQAQTNDEAYEAERRLFYVATTRSRKVLHLYRGNEYHNESTTISPFVFEGHYNE